MKLTVTTGFLWFPISRTSPVVKMHFLSEGVKFQEMDIRFDPEHPEYYAAMDLTDHAGGIISYCGFTGKDRSILPLKHRCPHSSAAHMTRTFSIGTDAIPC